MYGEGHGIRDYLGVRYYTSFIQIKRNYLNYFFARVLPSNPSFLDSMYFTTVHTVYSSIQRGYYLKVNILHNSL